MHTRNCELEQIIIGQSPAIQELRAMVRFAAMANSNVLITGESGTGKELVAETLHRASLRKDQPFIALNSGAIPRDLIESELFGHEKGSFTGAIDRHKGHFERASGGSLFLDEIGEMPINMQVRLLRVLEQRQIRRIGGSQDISVDVRLIAATHQSMEEALRCGWFRDDLYYRLAVLPIHLPSLAERKQDIPLLIEHFLDKGFTCDAPPVFTDRAMNILCDYDWPGNVRELRNLIERAAVFFPASEICEKEMEILMRPIRSARSAMRSQPSHSDRENDDRYDPNMYQDDSKSALAWHSAASPVVPSENQPFQLRKHLANEEKRLLLVALKNANGVVAAAADMVSLRRTTFVEKMKRYNIDREMAFV